jgi:hypothetical protein
MVSTPNVSSPYSVGHVELTQGPVKLTIPKCDGFKLIGTLADFTQEPHDVGFMGPENGAGAVYLVRQKGDKTHVNFEYDYMYEFDADVVM